MDGVDRSVAAQRAAARRLWSADRIGQGQQWRHYDEKGFFKHCRYTLELSPDGAAEGPLKGVLTARRLRRVESGTAAVPPKAWQAYAAELRAAGYVELAEQASLFLSQRQTVTPL